LCATTRNNLLPVKTLIRPMLRVVVLVALALGVWRVLVSRAGNSSPAIEPWEPMPRPVPRLTVVSEPEIDLTDPPWVEPVDGKCAPGYPVKGKVASGIYHVPGGLSYGRTSPDRCYATPADAESDGLRPAKR
jgi:hypothetical protein